MPFRRLARPLLAAVFVARGVDALMHSKAKVATAKPLLDKAQKLAPSVPAVDPALVVRAHGTVQVGAGLMMALGRAPRLAATVLAVNLIPSTVAEHPFWSENFPDHRKEQRTHFLKNLGLLGGLLLAISDTGGKPSLAWRVRHSRRSARRGADTVSRLSRRARTRAEQALD